MGYDISGFKLSNGLKLRDKNCISGLFKNKNKKFQEYTIIFYENSESFKFLISFKKRLLNPVKRNRIKRQVKEFIRLNQYKLKDFNCAILIKKIPPYSSQLFKELEFILK